MNKTCLWVAFVAVLAAGCGDGGSGVYAVIVETDQMTWPVAGVLNLEVSTPSGDIVIEVVEIDPISASIDRSCWSKERADAEAHVDDVTVAGSLAGDTLTIVAEMPDSVKRSYTADFRIGTPVIEKMDLGTAEGDIEVSGNQGNIEAETVDGDIDCDSAALAAGRWIILDATFGDITVSVPADVAAVFDIRTGYGRLEVEGFDSVTYTSEGKYRKAGYIGSGGATILITTVIGNATIEAR